MWPILATNKFVTASHNIKATTSSGDRLGTPPLLGSVYLKSQQ